MADETTLRLRIETDTTGVSTGVQRARDEFGRFIKVGQDAEEQLRRTGQAAGDTARQFQGLGEATHVSFGKLQAGMVAATVAGNALFEALDAVTRGLAAPITELLDAEQAAAMLQGTFGGLTAEMQQVATLASQLGANNAFFDDDALAQAAATLKLFGANAQAIQELLPYVNDLAIAFGVDVNDAAQLVGQALMGQTRGLARMVPEVRGANSQLEVLAALQASAARNTDIARQRTEGLGGQLALLKRQAADAAQGFGTAMLPALNAVLRVMNDNLLPVLGKMMAAFAGLSAFFGNLGKGLNLSDLTRVAGEAILNAEAQFNAVSARVEQRASRIASQAGNLTMAGSFGGGGAAAAAASRAAAPAARGVIGTEMLGPAVPSRLRYEVFTEDPGARKEREDRQREEAAAAKRLLDSEIAAKRQAQDALNAYYIESAYRIGDVFSSILGTIAKGQELSAQQVEGALKDVGKVSAGILGGAIGGPETGAAAARVTGMVTEVTVPLLMGTVKALSSALRSDAEKQADIDRQVAASFQKAAEDQQAAAAKFSEAADSQIRAIRLDAERSQSSLVRSQLERRASLEGPEAVLRKSLTERIGMFMDPTGINAPRNEYIAGVTKALQGLDTEKLREFGKRASELYGPDGKIDQVKLQALYRDLNLQAGAVADEVLLSLAEFYRSLPGASGGLQPGGIQNGTSPDRPVYVFDVRPREGFGFAPESFFFRNRGAGTSRAVAGNPLPVARPAPVSPRVAPGSGRGRLG
jgi:hypothetical protein